MRVHILSADIPTAGLLSVQTNECCCEFVLLCEASARRVMRAGSSGACMLEVMTVSCQRPGASCTHTVDNKDMYSIDVDEARE